MMRLFLTPAMTLVLALLPPAMTHAGEVGRLFFTPVERDRLDQLRKSSRPPEKAGAADAAPDPVQEALAAPPPFLAIQGYVRRSDGKGTVWVNRQPVQEQAATPGFSVGKLGKKDNRVEIKLSGSSKPISLKAGQSYDPESGLVIDGARQWPYPGDAAPPQGKPTSAPAPEVSPKP